MTCDTPRALVWFGMTRCVMKRLGCARRCTPWPHQVKDNRRAPTNFCTNSRQTKPSNSTGYRSVTQVSIPKRTQVAPNTDEGPTPWNPVGACGTNTTSDRCTKDTRSGRLHAYMHERSRSRPHRHMRTRTPTPKLTTAMCLTRKRDKPPPRQPRWKTPLSTTASPERPAPKTNRNSCS